MRPSALVLVVMAAVIATSCCLGGPFAPARHLVVHGRVLFDDGSPAPGTHLSLCANDGISVPDISEPGTCVEGVTDANGAYELDVGNVAPEGSDCPLYVIDPSSSGGAIYRNVRPPGGSDDPMRVEMEDVHLGTRGSDTFLDDLRLSIEGDTIRACTPRPLHRCVLYQGHEGRVRVWPPTDLEPVTPCEGSTAPASGADARRAGVFTRDDAAATDRLDPHDGVLLQCAEGRFELAE